MITDEPLSEEGMAPYDITTIMSITKCSRNVAIKNLRDADFDFVKAMIKILFSLAWLSPNEIKFDGFKNVIVTKEFIKIRFTKQTIGEFKQSGDFKKMVGQVINLL